MIKDMIEYFLVYALTMRAVVILLEGITNEIAQWWTYAWLAVVAEVILKKPVSALWKSK